MRDYGKLSDWNDDKGFGFVAPEQGGLRVFVHIRAFSHRTRRPRNGDQISYQIDWDAQGRPRATNVLFRDAAYRAPAKEPPRAEGLATAVVLAIAGMGGVISLTLLGKLPWWVPVSYASASLLLFCLYAFDKAAAMNRRWRTPESTLHFMSLIGGWPGALVAQSLFRHKSRKTSFREATFAIVFIHAAVLTLAAIDASLLDPTHLIR